MADIMAQLPTVLALAYNPLAQDEIVALLNDPDIMNDAGDDANEADEPNGFNHNFDHRNEIIATFPVILSHRNAVVATLSVILFCCMRSVPTSFIKHTHIYQHTRAHDSSGNRSNT
jgi:hypothetical protein